MQHNDTVSLTLLSGFLHHFDGFLLYMSLAEIMAQHAIWPSVPKRTASEAKQKVHRPAVTIGFAIQTLPGCYSTHGRKMNFSFIHLKLFLLFCKTAKSYFYLTMFTVKIKSNHMG